MVVIFFGFFYLGPGQVSCSFLFRAKKATKNLYPFLFAVAIAFLCDMQRLRRVNSWSSRASNRCEPRELISKKPITDNMTIMVDGSKNVV